MKEYQEVIDFRKLEGRRFSKDFNGKNGDDFYNIQSAPSDKWQWLWQIVSLSDHMCLPKEGLQFVKIGNIALFEAEED